MKIATKQTPYKKLTKGELQKIGSPFVLLQGLWLKESLVSVVAQNPIIQISSENRAPMDHLKTIESLTNQLQKWHPSTNKLIGLFGYFSYDFGNLLQGITNKINSPFEPLSYWLLPTKIKIINHSLKKAEIINISFTPKEQAQLAKYNSPIFTPQKPNPQVTKKLKSNLTKTNYFQKINQIKQAIINGETYQTNFAQKFSIKKAINPIELFNMLNKANPSPYQCLINTPHFSIVSNSPELLIKKTAKELITKPIKGTNKSKKVLLKSLKDTAELTMIVDLSRNDLSRISKTGTIKVQAHREIQKLKHLFHTYSTISGKPKDNLTLSELLLAIFPGGSITGCPKLRTMQIINNLEPANRGTYCGSAGFIKPNGDLMLNILIRTVVMSGEQLTFHSGGGIVIDSINEIEYNESLRKAEVILDVISKA